MKKLFFAIFSLALFFPTYGQSQGIRDLVNDSLTALKAGDWEEAAKLTTEATTRFGEDSELALKNYGPEFGIIWYRKGIAEMKLKKFEDAMASFEKCYKDFPNPVTASKGKGNAFNKKALLKWGEAALAAEKYDLAIEKWLLFLAERGNGDRYEKGPFYINLAIAYYKLGKFVEGGEQFELALKNRNQFPTPDLAIAAGFQAFTTAAILAKDEALFLDFVEKNRGTLTIPAYEMHRYSKILMKMAGDAIGAEMLRTALVLYQFVPSNEVAINQLQDLSARMGNVPKIPDGGSRLVKTSLDAQIESLKADQSNPDNISVIKLSAVAYIYEVLGYIRGAQANYAQLEKFHKGAKTREKNLFQLIRISSSLGEIDKVLEFGEVLVDLFPESEFAADVQKLMLTSLFFEGKYEEAIEVANSMIAAEKVVEGTSVHDMTFFVLGGSYYYTGQYEEAAPILVQHAKLYQDSPYIMTSEYFSAANSGRLLFWRRAAKQLDAFLEKYKDETEDPYFALAVFDRANAYYNLDETEKSKTLLEQLIKDYPENPSIVKAHVLIGNILETDGELDGAEKAYKNALEVAEQRQDASGAGEALYYIISLISEMKDGKDPSPRAKDAVPFADRYWKEFSKGSPYTAQVAVAQFPALNSVGRSEEALQRLQKVIGEIASTQGAGGLEEAIGSYTEAYLQKYSPKELKDHYYNFPGIPSDDKAVRALLRIAVIGVFEEVARESKEDPAAERQAKAMITVLFQNLKTDFALNDLTGLILVKLGDYLRENTSAPREALPYYDEALSRNDPSFRFGALLGRADVYGRSKAAADKEKAIQDFEIVFADSDSRKEREFALFRIIELNMEKKNYGQAAKRANQYLSKDKEKGLGFTAYTPQVGYILAQTFDARGQIDDALAMYTKVWSAHMGFIEVSAPAVKSWMELTFKRNRPAEENGAVSDRQGAYQGGYRYIDLTKSLKDQMNPEDRRAWSEVEDLVKQYAANPSVKSMKQLEAEKDN